MRYAGGVIMMSVKDFNYKQVIFYFPSDDKSKLRFKLDNLTIEDDSGKIIQQHSCHSAFILFIIGNISLTSVLLKKAKQFAFPIFLLGRNFRVDASFNHQADGNFLLRHKQYTTPDQKFVISKQLIAQKIQNQIQNLQRVRYRSEEENVTIEKLQQFDVEQTHCTQELMGLEGLASRLYFKTYFRQFNWQRRAPRTRCDIYNLLLDIGYTYLFHFVEAILSIYGFDLFCGVHHTFFYQRKSLVCDMVEPFRCIIDQRIRKAWNLKQIDPKDFFFSQGQYNLVYNKQVKYTKLFMKDILQHKKEIFLYFQSYYRWFMKEKPLSQFPLFNIHFTEE